MPHHLDTLGEPPGIADGPRGDFLDPEGGPDPGLSEFNRVGEKIDKGEIDENKSGSVD